MSYRSEVLADSPVQYLILNETSGTTATDSSTGAHNGTYDATGTTYSTPSMVPTDFATCVTLNGTAGRCRGGFNPFVTNSTLTFEGWARRATTTTNDTIFGGDETQAGGFPLLRANAATNDIGFWTSSALASATWTGACPAAGVAFHWAVTYTGSTKQVTLYINGLTKGPFIMSADFTATPGNVEWGAWGAINDPWVGDLGHCAVYNSVLSVQRIQAHYSAGTSAARAIPLYVPNKSVGPIALRRTFRQPYVPQVIAPTNVTNPLTITANVTLTPTIQKQVNKGVLANVTLLATAIKQVNKAVTANVTITPSLLPKLVKLVTLLANVAVTATMQRQANKLLTVTVAITATIARQINKLLSANVTITATLTAKLVKLLTLTANVAITATIQRQANKLLTTSSTLTATITRQTNKLVRANVAITPTIARKTLKNLTANVTGTATIVTGSVHQLLLTATSTITATIGTVVQRAGVGIRRLRTLLGVGQ
jgi:hypothetical protein